MELVAVIQEERAMDPHLTLSPKAGGLGLASRACLIFIRQPSAPLRACPQDIYTV